MLEKRFINLEVWIVAKKLYPQPWTPNPRYRTNEKKIGYKNNTLYFWWRSKNQEVLMCFLCVFRERRKMCRKHPGKEQDPEKSFFFWFGDALGGARVWYKTMKHVLWGFWPLVKLGLTRGISAEKGTLGVPVFEQIAPRHFGCSGGPTERKWYFWIFRGLACKLTVDKIWYQHMVTSVSDSFSFSEFVFYTKTLLIIPIT